MLVDTGRNDENTKDRLYRLIADLHQCYANMHNLHWNVEGQGFFDYHEHLQELYEMFAEHIDEVAERTLMIGHRPLTRLQDYLNVKSNDNEELESRAYSVQEAIDNVIFSLNILIENLNRLMSVSQEAGDEGTFDFAVEMLREYEKQRWFWSAAKGE